MLDASLKEQLKDIFTGLEADFTLDITVSSQHESRSELLELLGDVAVCSNHITCLVNEGNGLKFTLLKNGKPAGITFRAVPNGHEFTSLLLAILNLDDKGKHVAVVGGGNSGVEAAIDLAGICSKVTVFEFMDELKADNVLQERLKSLPNVEVFVSSQTTEVVGNGDKLTALHIKDRKTEEERTVELDGVFVQIGLSANSRAFCDVVETNRAGEILIDMHCRTNVPGIYAAGDVSTVPYKQIVISMGEGAKAALAAFDDRVRGII